MGDIAGSLFGGGSSGGGGGGYTSAYNLMPNNLKSILDSYLTRSETASNAPYQQYEGERVAQLTPFEQLARTYANQSFGQTAPAIQGANQLNAQLTSKAIQGPTMENISPYMSPFQQSVIDQAKRETVRDFEMNTLPGVGRQAAGAGAFGGSRQALLESEAYRNLNRNLSDIQERGSQASFTNAQDQYFKTIQGASDLAKSTAQTALLGQNAVNSDVNLMTGLGQTERGLNQAQLDVGYNNFQNKMNYPINALNILGSSLGNVSPYFSMVGTPSGGGSNSSFLGDLGSIASTGMQLYSLFSDKNLKENIKEVGELDNGLPVYKYNYKGSPTTQIGVMAQDVEKKKPEAVGERAGYKTVNYDEATKNFAEGGFVDFLTKATRGRTKDEDEEPRGLEALLKGEGNSTDWLLGAISTASNLLDGQYMFSGGGFVSDDERNNGSISDTVSGWFKPKETITWDDGKTTQTKGGAFTRLMDLVSGEKEGDEGQGISTKTLADAYSKAADDTQLLEKEQRDAITKAGSNMASARFNPLISPYLSEQNSSESLLQQSMGNLFAEGGLVGQNPTPMKASNFTKVMGTITHNVVTPPPPGFAEGGFVEDAKNFMTNMYHARETDRMQKEAANTIRHNNFEPSLLDSLRKYVGVEQKGTTPTLGSPNKTQEQVASVLKTAPDKTISATTNQQNVATQGINPNVEAGTQSGGTATTGVEAILERLGLNKDRARKAEESPLLTFLGALGAYNNTPVSGKVGMNRALAAMYGANEANVQGKVSEENQDLDYMIKKIKAAKDVQALENSQDWLAYQKLLLNAKLGGKLQGGKSGGRTPKPLEDEIAAANLAKKRLELAKLANEQGILMGDNPTKTNGRNLTFDPSTGGFK